ncbi:MAG TPA: hypothetical protein VKB39_01625 [Candidatus Baltobacteraceae bacterium]|nr:hypothetical protein [Candidatus Baltobacteraceae bacterium]
MRNARIGIIVVAGLAAVCVGWIVTDKVGEINDRRIAAANPIDVRCRSFRTSSSDGTVHGVKLWLKNKGAKAINWVEVMYHSDVSGAYHVQFKHLAPHAAQSGMELMTWKKYEPGPVQCEDYIVVYSDGSEWRAPSRH